MNGFLRGHRVLAVQRELIDRGDASFWAFCVEYLEGEVPRELDRRGRIDYKEILNEQDFELFSRLRTLRKELAEQDAVPVYTIFTNEQLAAMVQEKAGCRADIGKIEGVGASRLEKYADRFLALITRDRAASASESGPASAEAPTAKEVPRNPASQTKA